MWVGDGLIPIVYAVANLTHTSISIPSGRLADRYGKEKISLIRYSAFLVARAIIPGNRENHLLGTAYGLCYLAVGVYYFLVNTLIRAIWEKRGLGVSSLYSGTLAILAIVATIAHQVSE